MGRRPGAQEEARGARVSTSFGFGQPTFEGNRGILAVEHEEHHAVLRSQKRPPSSVLSMFLCPIISPSRELQGNFNEVVPSIAARKCSDKRCFVFFADEYPQIHPICRRCGFRSLTVASPVPVLVCIVGFTPRQITEASPVGEEYLNS